MNITLEFRQIFVAENHSCHVIHNDVPGDRSLYFPTNLSFTIAPVRAPPVIKPGGRSGRANGGIERRPSFLAIIALQNWQPAEKTDAYFFEFIFKNRSI